MNDELDLIIKNPVHRKTVEIVYGVLFLLKSGWSVSLVLLCPVLFLLRQQYK